MFKGKLNQFKCLKRSSSCVDQIYYKQNEKRRICDDSQRESLIFSFIGQGSDHEMNSIVDCSFKEVLPELVGFQSFEEGQISIIDKPSKLKTKKSTFEENICQQLEEEKE